MKLLSTASVLGLACLAAPAFALDIGGGFSLSGNFEYEHVSTESSDFGAGFLDADISYQHSSGFGAFVGIDAVSADGFSGEAFYGALSYSGDFGKIQIGAPRNALDDYVGTPKIGGIDIVDFQISALTGSILPTALLQGNETALGLRYDGTFGGASIGASYLDVDGTSVVDLGVNYSLGQTRLMAGIEHISNGGSSEASYFLGAEHDFGQLTAGAVLGKVELIGDAQSVQAYVVYSPTDRLDLTASLLHADTGGGSGELYGLDANFDLSDSVYVEAGYTGGDLFGGNADFYALSLGVNF